MQESRGRSVQWLKILALSGINLLVLSFLCWNIIIVQGNMIKQAEESYIQCKQKSLQDKLTAIEQKSDLLNQEIVNSLVNKPILKPGQKGNANLPLPSSFSSQDKYLLSGLKLISPKGMVNWSYFDPTEKGLDVGYKRSIERLIYEKQGFRTFEFADERLNLVNIRPIFNQDKYNGASVLYISMDKALNNKISKKEKDVYALFKLDGIQSDLLWQSKKSQIVLNTDDLDKIQKGFTYTRLTQNKNITLLIMPIKDTDGIAIGYIQGEISRQLFSEARTSNLLFLFIMILLILIVDFLMLAQEGIALPQYNPKAARLTENGKINRVPFSFKNHP